MRRSTIALIGLYLSAIVIANLTVAWFGPSIAIVNAFVFIALWYMLPGRAPQDHVNRFSADAKLLCHIINIRSTRAPTSNLNNLSFGQAGQAVSLASCEIIWTQTSGVIISSDRHTTAPALFIHICNVILNRPKEQMTRIYARTIITFMKNPKAIRDRAIMQLPRNTMSFNNMALVCRHKVSVPRNLRSDPRPTRTEIGTVAWYWSVLVNFRPETTIKATRHSIHTLFTAILAATRRRLANRYLELFMAISTYTEHSISPH